MALEPARARRAAEAGLCLFAAALPLSIAGANIGWAICAAGLAALALGGEPLDFSARKSAIEKPLYIFLAVSLISDLCGVAPAHSLRFFNQDAHKVWLYLLLSVGLAAVPARTPLYALAAGFAVAAVIGLGQSLPSFAPGIPEGERIRAHAFSHPVTYGELMAAGFLGAVLFVQAPPAFLKAGGRRAAAGLAALFGAALLMSNTRGAIVGAAGGLWLAFLAAPRLRRWAWWSPPALLLALIVSEASRPDRSLIAELAGLWSPASAHTGQLMRLVLWGAAFKMGLDHPLTGVGHNNFRAEFPAYYPDAILDGSASTFGTAHNLYLHHFAERGLLGLAAVLLLLGAMCLRAWRRAALRPDAWQLWALAASAAFVLMNLTEVALQTEIVWMLYFFIWIWAEARFRGGERAG